MLCQISEGRTGACDRWGNFNGVLTRVDPVVLFKKVAGTSGEITGFLESQDWDGSVVSEGPVFVSGVGSGTTYPDYKPAPFIVSSKHQNVDMVTVVTEGIFSYCSFKVKIDTDRWLGPEQATVRCQGEAVGHVTTAEYGSQMLSLGGVHHLTGGSKKEGRVTCEMMMDLGNRKPVELAIEGGSQLTIAAGKAPVVNGVEEQRMRVGCGSATIGIFAQQWYGQVDEVVVVDDHITGVLTEHQAGRCLGLPPSGIKIKGKKSTPGRYFQVAKPGTGWGGTDITDPLSIVTGFDPEVARPGERILMVSTTGEDAAFFVLDEHLNLVPAAMPERGAPGGGAHRRELRAGSDHGAVPRRRGRQPARGRDRQPGPAYALDPGSAGERELRRRARLRLAGRRHHADGGCHAHAGQLLRLGTHAGHRRAHRVHHAPVGLPGAGRAHGPGARHGGCAQERARASGGVGRVESVADGPEVMRACLESSAPAALPGNERGSGLGPGDSHFTIAGRDARPLRGRPLAFLPWSYRSHHRCRRRRSCHRCRGGARLGCVSRPCSPSWWAS